MATLHPLQRLMLLSVATSLATIGLKFGAWQLSGSVSLYSDALESLVNLSAALVALVAVSIAAQPADAEHTYGHDKAEYFASGVEGALILVAAVAIVWSALDRLFHPQALSSLMLAVGVSLLASLLNGITALILSRSARRHDSITLEADAQHLLTDVWTSIGLAIGLVALLWLPPSWSWLDPVLACAVALNIIRTGWQLLRRSVDGLMDVTLPEADVATIRTVIADAAGADQWHGLRTRKAGPRRFIEFSLLVPGDWSVARAHQLCDALEAGLEQRLGNTQVTIHVEPRPDPVSRETLV